MKIQSSFVKLIFCIKIYQRERHFPPLAAGAHADWFLLESRFWMESRSHKISSTWVQDTPCVRFCSDWFYFSTGMIFLNFSTFVTSRLSWWWSWLLCLRVAPIKNPFDDLSEFFFFFGCSVLAALRKKKVCIRGVIMCCHIARFS